MMHRLSEPQVRTLGFIFGPIIVVLSTLVAYTIGSYWLALIVAVCATVAVALLARALAPPWAGEEGGSQLRSLLILSTLAAAVLSPDSVWDSILQGILKHFNVTPPEAPTFHQRVVVLVIVTLAVIALNLIWNRRQLTPPSNVAPSEANSEFNSSGYLTLRDEFCHYMVSQLDQYDRDVQLE
jgi:hypothetical protein